MNKKCDYCNNAKEALEKQKKGMDKYGFFVHYVFDEDNHDYANIHSHGIKDSFNHEDFQMVIAIRYETAIYLMHDLVNRIKTGETFADGQIINDLIKSDKDNSELRVQFKDVISDDDRELLRILFPDRDGKLPGEDGCNPLYNDQLKVFMEEGE